MDHQEFIETLRRAYSCFNSGDMDGYTQEMSSARTALSHSPLLCPERGEYTLISSMPCMMDCGALKEKYLQAAEMFDGAHSEVVTCSAPLFLGADSVLSLFWRAGTSSDGLPAKISELAALSGVLTGSRYGCDSMCAAELAYYRGDLATAEVQAYKALYLARNTEQLVLAMCASKLLAHIAQHRIDTESWKFALRTIDFFAADDGPNRALRKSYSQLINCELSLELGDCSKLPQWLTDGDFGAEYGRSFYSFTFRLKDDRMSAIHFATYLWLHCLYLLKTAQYARILALDEVLRLYGLYSLDFVRMYFLFARGLALYRLEEKDEAQTVLREAVTMAAGDRLWLIPSEFSSLCGNLIDEAAESIDARGAAQIRRLAQGFADSEKLLREAVLHSELPENLTDRELEVARLAAKSLSNAEISQALSISQNTVKKHLKSIFAKFSVDKRGKLREFLN